MQENHAAQEFQLTPHEARILGLSNSVPFRHASLLLVEVMDAKMRNEAINPREYAVNSVRNRMIAEQFITRKALEAITDILEPYVGQELADDVEAFVSEH